MRKKGIEQYCSIATILLALGLVILLWYSNTQDKIKVQQLEEENRQEMIERQKDVDSKKMKIVNEDSILPQNLEQLNQLITIEQFTEHISDDNSFSYGSLYIEGFQVQSDNMLLYLELSAAYSTQMIVETYDVANKKVESTMLYINSQKTGYYIPLPKQKSFSGVKYRIVGGNGDEGIAFSNMILLTSGEQKLPPYLCGSYVIDDNSKETELNTTDFEQRDAIDSVIDGDILYVASMNRVSIVQIGKNDQLQELASVTGLGTIRRIALSNNRKTLVAACREYGVYLIDVQNPNQPTIIGHIDTLELASGLDICDEYLFIASRYYGIEVYDISNPENPRFISCMKSQEESERIDCTVHEGYLYAGVWGTQKVEIFDVRSINNPRYIGYVETDGNAYGLQAEGDTLVVATGFHSTRNSALTQEEYGYATGNGITLFDIKDPEKPRELSTIRSDGRYYQIGKDYWNVTISNGVAYFSDLYNGLYAYDISNPAAPVEMEHFTISVTENNSEYQKFDDGMSVFSYNQSERMQLPMTSVAVADGVLYITDEIMGVHQVKANYAKTSKRESAFKFEKSGEFRFKEWLPKNCEMVPIDGQAFAVAEYEEQYYLGTSEGIMILNHDFEEVDMIPTTTAVRDIEIVGNRIFTAESVGGIGIYEISENTVVKRGGMVLAENNRANVCTQIAVAADGNHVVASCRLNLFALLDVSDANNIMLVEYLKSGAAYYRNVCRGVENDKNVIYLTTAAGISELIFREDGTYVYNQISNTDFYTSTGGFTYMDGERILAIAENGYRILDISDDSGIDLSTASELVKVPNVLLKGVPYYRNNVLVVTYALTGEISIINLKNIEKPELVQQISVKSATDGPYISSDGTVIVPARYEGLIVIR